MRKVRVEAAQHIAARLFPAESATGEAIACAAALAHAVQVARRNAGLSSLVGHAAETAVAEAIGLMVQAQGKLNLAHIEFQATKDKVGLRELAVGGWAEKAGDDLPLTVGQTRDQLTAPVTISA